ncbi:unnamed protein product [Ambrosiozyma monospora]|uniref:Unnamed protein product n=1 Tax=Ambrosiozyma monospora TaxID=43982 RepID=A0ACB5SR35_AMBMO|nr:unnamed protein product [Ambrosiozyma monospora]
MSTSLAETGSLKKQLSHKAFEISEDVESIDREIIPEYADEYNPDGLYVALPEDKARFRTVKGHISKVAYLMLLVELAERASYYGVSNVLTNFIMRPLPDGSSTGSTHTANTSAGALGLGLQPANAVTTLLTFLAYVAPLFGGYIADSKLGRYKAIMIGVWVGLVSHILFIIAGLPPVLKHGKSALAPTILGILSLAIGTGFIKPNLLPLLLDQYEYRTNVLKKLPSGEVVLVDRDRTMDGITMVFYWFINVGAFFQLATSYAARDVGYWLAFLTPGLMYLIVCVVMLFLGPHIYHPDPQGSILGDVVKVLLVCFKGNFIKRFKEHQFFQHAYPENMKARGQLYFNKKKQTPITWSKQDVKDFHSTFIQSGMFLYWVIFNLNDNGLSAALNAQAGAMTTKNVPNDLFNNFNPLVIIFLIPVLDRLVYPLLEKLGWRVQAVQKIFFGFFLGAITSMVSAIIQWRIYETSPCGYQASTCDSVSPISAWVEVSVYALAAAGECFCMTQGYEVAYARAPQNAKGLVMALFLVMTALSAAIIEIITPSLEDPNLIWPFVALAVIGFIFAVAFLIQYWNLEKIMTLEDVERERNVQEAKKEKDEQSDSDAPVDEYVDVEKNL